MSMCVCGTDRLALSGDMVSWGVLLCHLNEVLSGGGHGTRGGGGSWWNAVFCEVGEKWQLFLSVPLVSPRKSCPLMYSIAHLRNTCDKKF